MRNLTSRRLLQIYNTIFSTGIIPQQWKISTIIPINKPNKDKSVINGYRPISLIPCTSKLLEKIVASRISWFLLKHKFLSSQQVAFKPKKGTLDALTYIDHLTASTISHRGHLSILSIDFEKAFDRIGVHTIIEQLLEWKLGNKIVNYVFAFLTNRKIRVRVNNTYSSIMPLHNGIPQGSPLSVVLFQIATERLNRIISTHKYFKHVIYADDLYIVIKHKVNVDLQEEIDDLFTSIDDWCRSTGSKISFSKTKCLHICRKHMCLHTNFVIQNTEIETVNSLKILGVIFNKNFSWSSHIDHLKLSLQTRINLIKCLASSKSNAHQNALLNAVQSLIVSKLDYGLTIYGKAPKSLLNKINPMYHSAVRIALGALRSTPIINLLAESGMCTLKERFNKLLVNLITQIKFPSEAHLIKRISSIQTLTTLKRPSSLFLAMKLATKLGIDPKPHKAYFPTEPPWNLNKKVFVVNLIDLGKKHTPLVEFCSLFKEISSSFTNKKWNLLFTDGSKTQTTTACAVINHKLQTDFMAILDENTSIFTAESAAIYWTLNKYKNVRGKFILCSDSQSAIKAIQNINNRSIIVSKIRDILIKYHTKFKIMWIPGHAGIFGNTLADEAAKFASNAPILRYIVPNRNDLKRLAYEYLKQQENLEWDDYEHYYKQFNTHKTTQIFPNSVSRLWIKKFIRLRLGHTSLTHQHIFNSKPAELCPACGLQQVDIKHIVFSCTKIIEAQLTIFGSQCLPDLLKTTTPVNIQNVHKILTHCNIWHLI
ncbi:uncharacterized protein LOC142230962 [Haematobia irritans]|uniref:uncharacterized protein LOC142230962 n=1 Tax=Haematobia irritans TaxID=7368 RepID=UPI003F504A00